MEAAIMAAFVDDSDEAWGDLLEATGAAHYDDARSEAPAINVQHAETGESPPDKVLPDCRLYLQQRAGCGLVLLYGRRRR